MKSELKKNYIKCSFCGRRLKNEKAISIGYGPICLKKLKLLEQSKYRNKELFTINEK